MRANGGGGGVEGVREEGERGCRGEGRRGEGGGGGEGRGKGGGGARARRGSKVADAVFTSYIYRTWSVIY